MNRIQQLAETLSNEEMLELLELLLPYVEQNNAARARLLCLRLKAALMNDEAVTELA